MEIIVETNCKIYTFLKGGVTLILEKFDKNEVRAFSDRKSNGESISVIIFALSCVVLTKNVIFGSDV